MARKPQQNSIYRLAQEVGVSAATVSRAINNRAGVSEEVRAKVAKLMAQYQFTPNYPTSRRNRVAFLSHYDSSGYVIRALAGVFAFAEGRDFDLSLSFCVEKDPERLLQQIRDQQCSAVIAGPGEGFRFAAAELASSGLPVVFLDTEVESSGRMGYVDNDSYTGSGLATRHLIELGHRRIGYLRHYRNPVEVLDHQQRFQGYLDTMAAAGLTVNPTWVARNPRTECFARGSAGRAAMEVLLCQAPELTAVMAVDDGMALGAITAIHRCGRRIPNDLSVVGFDNYDDTANWFPALTTIDHPIEAAARQAAESLWEALKNPGDWTPPKIKLPTTLVVRESTGPAPRS